MSYSEICIMKSDYSGEFLEKKLNCWAIAPNCWAYLFNKYIKDKNQNDTWLNNKLFIDMMNYAISSDDYLDKIVALFTNLSFFEVKDRGIVIEAFKDFFSSYIVSDLDDKGKQFIDENLNELIETINSIDENKYKYFGLHCSSVDDCFKSLFCRYDQNKGEHIIKMTQSDIKDYYNFVQIEKDCINIYKLQNNGELKFEVKL